MEVGAMFEFWFLKEVAAAYLQLGGQPDTRQFRDWFADRRQVEEAMHNPQAHAMLRTSLRVAWEDARASDAGDLAWIKAQWIADLPADQEEFRGMAEKFWRDAVAMAECLGGMPRAAALAGVDDANAAQGR